MQKKFTKQVNEKFAEKAAITMLTEGESKRKYKRKRLAQSFTTQDQVPSKRPKKHSPNFSNVEWDKENLEQTLCHLPRDTPINWSAVARDHGVPGGNAGQVVKEIATPLGLPIADSSTPRRKQNTSQKNTTAWIRHLHPS